MKGKGDLVKRTRAVLGLVLILTTSGTGAFWGRSELEFSLHDAFGREVQSQDYKGVPVFLEFGACW
ncbi:MAG: hypothetical protein ACYTEQ_11085 [Planctomycetota bacterium]|jgi:hypothetical protein